MRAPAFLWLAYASLTACEPAREEPAGSPPSAAAVPAAQMRFYPAKPLSELREPALSIVDSSRARAVGIAYTSFEASAPNELTILNDTAHEVQTSARLRFYPIPNGGWSDTLWVRQPKLYSQLERASLDDYGLQVASVHGSWLRVIYAYDSAGAAQLGWVRVAPGHVMYKKCIPSICKTFVPSF
jgi:hypothetical protein